MVKIQHLINRIAETMYINRWNIPVLPPNIPGELHIKAFQSEIVAIKELLPSQLKQDGKNRGHFYGLS